MHAQRSQLQEAMAHARLAEAAEVPVKVLSQGQRRRVALVRLAFSARQPLWILDEPFSSLDAVSIEHTEQTVLAHLHRGGMVIFTTHQEVALGGVKVRSVELGAH
jgi:heme exporter protein A